MMSAQEIKFTGKHFFVLYFGTRSVFKFRYYSGALQWT